MRESCLLFFRQGWLGLPIFFVGLVSLAFSQFENSSGGKFESSEELVSVITSTISESELLLDDLVRSRENLINKQYSELQNEITRLKSDIGSGSQELLTIQDKLSAAKNRFTERITTIDGRIEISSDRLTDCRSIFSDVKDNYGGNIDDAKPALLALNENLSGTRSELVALTEMLDGLRKDNAYEISMISNELVNFSSRTAPLPPSSVEADSSSFASKSIKSKIFEGLGAPSKPTIQGKLSSSIKSSENPLTNNLRSNASEINGVDVIEKLRTELKSSKNVQAELSLDSAELQSDLRKAYREIVSLQANLKESQQLITELEKTKESLYKTDDGSPATVATVSKRIVRLEKELDLAREDLRQSRQSLLLEQRRSSAMIESISSELDRTRRQLDEARLALQNNTGDSARMAFLERELQQAKSALKMAQLEPIDPDSNEFVNLQDELRKSLGEIARMQIELGHMDELKDELAQLKSSMESVGGSRAVNPEYVNKLIVELNAANKKIDFLQGEKADERGNLTDGVSTLEEELFATKQELEVVRGEFAKAREQIAKKEFEFATTIKDLEEEAQKAQVRLQNSKNPVVAVPFVAEMEDTLAASEARIRLLSEQFANEQARATEVIASLQEELAMAQARHKETLTLLSRNEFDLQSKGKEISEIEKEKKALQEELEVVKVIVGQLNDLNQVLEETKQTQIVQNTDSGQMVESLKDELNRLKVELVVVAEDRDKMRDDFSERIEDLKRELEDTRNQLVEEQEVFSTSTLDSKNIVLDLKNELEQARQEIATLKSVGTSGMIESESAVLQLQEALGTIRILKESLDDAEQANLEVDNLKSELAEVMSNQLENLKLEEDRKNSLIQKIENLESEIAILRENSSGDLAQNRNQSTLLKTNLELANAQIKSLENKLLNNEASKISTFADLEDEISALRTENQNLQNQLSSIGPREAKTIATLEKQLADAFSKLEGMESGNLPSDAGVASLEEDLSAARSEIRTLEERLKISENSGINSLVVLEDELAALKNENTRLKVQISQVGPEQNVQIARLEEELSETIIKLRAVEGDQFSTIGMAKLKEDNERLVEEIAQLNLLLEDVPSKEFSDADSNRIAQLESQLEKAIAEIENLSSDQPDLSDAELELSIAQQAIEKLSNSLDQRDRAQKDLTRELEIALQKIDSLQSTSQNSPSSDNLSRDHLAEVAALQMEIDSLKAELQQVMSDDFENSSDDNYNSELAQVQEELRNAVAESFELQMELEQTKLSVNQLEEKLAQQPSGSLDDFMEESKQAELEAMQRIEELTNALRNSEQLRMETEDLLTEMERNAKTDGQDISNDPRFLALQQEMVGLQNDLIAVQQMEDPRVAELEGALEASRSDALKLNDEFKGVLADFSNLKNELSALESENRRIREISLAQARESSNQMGESMQIQINNLSQENANLLAQIAEKDRRISGLRDDLAGTTVSPNESELRTQLVQLQIKNQSLSNGESQARRENQQLRQDIALAKEDLLAAQSQLRQLSLNKQSPLERPSPKLLAEIEELKSENLKLQSQANTFANSPTREMLESKVRDLNQQSMNYKIQLDREKIMVNDLKDQLSDARSIKQEVIERGKSSKLKIDLLNEELSGARNRVSSLEKALIAARQAIRVLQSGGSESSMIPVSTSSTFGTNIGSTGSGLSRNSYLPSRRIQLPSELGDRSSMLQLDSNRETSLSSLRSAPANVQNSQTGNSNLQLRAKVQFLDNKNRPAGFTEFFLVEDDLSSIMASEGILVPSTAGIQSPAEYWARAVQRGYRFPGVAAKIRGALAKASLKRIKTNSLGEGNLTNLAAGRYYIVGASPLGQVGVVWSKPVTINSGDNRIDLDLRDAAWAQ